MFTVLIPARYASTRLPGKPLADIAGRPMVVRVAERARESGAQRVVVATDDERVIAAARAHGVDALMTRSDHPTGTDRLAEAAALLGLAPDAIVVNVQGDEPLLEAPLIRRMAELLARHPDASIATACHPIDDAAEAFNPNVFPGRGTRSRRTATRCPRACRSSATMASTRTASRSSSGSRSSRRRRSSASRRSSSCARSGTATGLSSRRRRGRPPRASTRPRISSVCARSTRPSAEAGRPAGEVVPLDPAQLTVRAGCRDNAPARRSRGRAGVAGAAVRSVPTGWASCD